MKRYEVHISRDALQDLEDVCTYVAEHDAPAKAEHVLDRLLELVGSLETDPSRGSRPRELEGLGTAEYRQAFFKPYRVVYAVADAAVYILLIADGRRDLRTLLAQRLLGA